MASSNSEDKTNPNQWFRLVLGGGLTLLSVIGIFWLSFVIIQSGKSENGAQLILNSVLPLVSSWVGLVLAFFYSRENFEAATHSVNEMAKQLTAQDKLHAAKVKDSMIRRVRFHAEIVKNATDGKPDFASAGLKLSLILDRLDKADKGSRIPILDENDHPLYLIHRSNIDRFLATKALDGHSIKALNLKDFLDHPDMQKILDHGFALVRQDADLAEAKDKMDNSRDCLDVLVTQNGKEKEPVLGWITNAKIEEVAKV